MHEWLSLLTEVLLIFSLVDDFFPSGLTIDRELEQVIP